MYIRNHFKNGKIKKWTNKVESLYKLMEVLEGMNNGKGFQKITVENNFLKRDLVFDDGSIKNMWEIMKSYGFIEID